MGYGGLASVGLAYNGSNYDCGSRWFQLWLMDLWLSCGFGFQFVSYVVVVASSAVVGCGCAVGGFYFFWDV